MTYNVPNSLTTAFQQAALPRPAFRPIPLMGQSISLPPLLDFDHDQHCHRIWLSYRLGDPMLSRGTFLLLSPNGIIDQFVTTPDGLNIAFATRLRDAASSRRNAA